MSGNVLDLFSVDRSEDRWPHAHHSPRIRFLLDGLQSPINIGMCARIAEVYGVELLVHDPRGVTQDIGSAKVISDYACGAWQRAGSIGVSSDMASLMKQRGTGRRIASCLRPDAVDLRDFEFESGDVIMFGNEYDGLASTTIDRADAKIYIAMPDAFLPKPPSHVPIDPCRRQSVNENGKPNLNVATAAGIVAYAYACWLQDRGFATERAADRVLSLQGLQGLPHMSSTPNRGESR
jgi:tRNA G18 (ribose-2'-O)-methylase SpoU